MNSTRLRVWKRKNIGKALFTNTRHRYTFLFFGVNGQLRSWFNRVSLRLKRRVAHFRSYGFAISNQAFKRVKNHQFLRSKTNTVAGPRQKPNSPLKNIVDAVFVPCKTTRSNSSQMEYRWLGLLCQPQSKAQRYINGPDISWRASRPSWAPFLPFFRA